jgi:hypothetical protein
LFEKWHPLAAGQFILSMYISRSMWNSVDEISFFTLKNVFGVAIFTTSKSHYGFFVPGYETT